MNCEELVTSIVIITILLIIMACTCTRSFETDPDSEYDESPNECNRDQFTTHQVTKNIGRPSTLNNPDVIWGGVPIDYRSTMDHAYPSINKGFLPVTNSMTAIRRLQAEDTTPPWSAPNPDAKESFDSRKGGDFVDLIMAKRGTIARTFQPGLTKNNTAIRHLKV